MVLLEFGIFLEQALDLVDGVQDGGVVLAAEGAADLGERGVGELAGEVHRDLAGEGDGLGAVLGPHVGELDAEELGRLPLDVLDGDDLLFLAPEVGEDLLGELDAHLAAGERAEGDHPGERALDLADVGLDAAGDEVGDVVGRAGPARSPPSS